MLSNTAIQCFVGKYWSFKITLQKLVTFSPSTLHYPDLDNKSISIRFALMPSVGTTEPTLFANNHLVRVVENILTRKVVTFCTYTTPVSVIPLCSTGLEVAALLAEGPLQGGALIWWHNGETFIWLHQTHHWPLLAAWTTLHRALGHRDHIDSITYCQTNPYKSCKMTVNIYI